MYEILHHGYFTFSQPCFPGYYYERIYVVRYEKCYQVYSVAITKFLDVSIHKGECNDTEPGRYKFIFTYNHSSEYYHFRVSEIVNDKLYIRDEIHHDFEHITIEDVVAVIEYLEGIKATQEYLSQ